MSGQTLAQKVIARACGRARVETGEIVTANVDLAMVHDSSGPRRLKPVLERLGVDVWDPDKIAVITDHFVPAYDDGTREIQALTKDWVRAQNICAFHDQMGICHVVLPEQGHLQPGMFVVGGDSHSPTGGAFGAYMFGIGATEMAGVMATGKIWIMVPETIMIEWRGALQDYVTAKDIMLFLCGALGMDGGGYQAVQYSGSAISALSMRERMTLANMTAELGGQTGLIEPDRVTLDFLEERGVSPGSTDHWRTDADARLLAHHRFHANRLAPQVAAPHSPANARDISAYDKTPVSVAYIGACTGAKLDDLRNAASVLENRNPARGVEILVAPASVQDQEIAASEGVMKIFEDAGARILPTSCGICAGYGANRLGEDVVCISSTARNFKGRMGAPSSQVYLGSPYTVAASAIAGYIADPREVAL
ncbi:MAG: 3-isopropylmalate dehydratase large subunit [Hyphomicrobiales bacterium]